MADRRPHSARLTIASLATTAPMGAEAYQEHIWRGAADALVAVDGRPWDTRRLVARSLRSPLPGNRRLPMKALATAGSRLRREFGRILFSGGGVSHRMNLEIPPPPSGDVVTLHDVVAWRFPDESAPVAAARAELRQADAVICVSDFSAQEAADLLGIRTIHVIPNGVDARYFSAAPLDPGARARWGIPDRYVLHAGGAAARKNLDGLAAAWPAVRRERPGLSLVLAGPAHPRREALFARLPGTILTGRLPDELMPSLVAGAEAVVVPSLYEGFGLPVLEGMAARVPVVAARTSSLPEVAGGHAILTGTTGSQIAAGILDATSGDTSLEARVAGGYAHACTYTWERSALGHARIWSSLI